MKIGATVLPKFPKDSTDRNRTSPFALQEINSNLECQDQTQVLPDATLY